MTLKLIKRACANCVLLSDYQRNTIVKERLAIAAKTNTNVDASASLPLTLVLASP